NQILTKVYHVFKISSIFKPSLLPYDSSSSGEIFFNSDKIVSTSVCMKKRCERLLDRKKIFEFKKIYTSALIHKDKLKCTKMTSWHQK
uniref:Ovule protein n=1 Tax=Romanomermis culicivorax TaxID=13658 RepID=A0A915JT23_ROMCU